MPRDLKTEIKATLATTPLNGVELLAALRTRPHLIARALKELEREDRAIYIGADQKWHLAAT